MSDNKKAPQAQDVIDVLRDANIAAKIVCAGPRAIIFKAEGCNGFRQVGRVETRKRAFAKLAEVLK